MHGNRERKYLKHIKKDGKYACKICEATYVNSSHLKVHIIKKHSQKQLLEKQLDPVLVLK